MTWAWLLAVNASWLVWALVYVRLETRPGGGDPPGVLGRRRTSRTALRRPLPARHDRCGPEPDETLLIPFSQPILRNLFYITLGYRL